LDSSTSPFFVCPFLPWRVAEMNRRKMTRESELFFRVRVFQAGGTSDSESPDVSRKNPVTRCRSSSGLKESQLANRSKAVLHLRARFSCVIGYGGRGGRAPNTQPAAVAAAPATIRSPLRDPTQADPCASAGIGRGPGRPLGRAWRPHQLPQTYASAAWSSSPGRRRRR